ncbi:AAA family ATPase [Sphingomonas sp. RS6]
MSTLIGNSRARAALAAAMVSGELHHAWLIAGPEGVGKGSFARIAARRMLAEAAEPARLAPGWEVPEATRTASLIAAGSHPDFRVLERPPKDSDKPGEALARSITIAQVRSLQPMFATKPALGPRRVVVIDAIDDLERGGANALLKNLEEPPAGTIFLLVSHAPGRLLPTIRSRCRLLRFDPLPDADTAAVLRQHLPDASDAELDALVAAAGGSPGRALRFAGLDLGALEADMAALAASGDRDNAIRTRLARQLGVKAAQPRYEAFLERAPSFIAAQAREKRGEALRTALDAHAAAADLAGAALGLSLDSSATSFEMAGIIARLGQR